MGFGGREPGVNVNFPIMLMSWGKWLANVDGKVLWLVEMYFRCSYWVTVKPIEVITPNKRNYRNFWKRHFSLRSHLTTRRNLGKPLMSISFRDIKQSWFHEVPEFVEFEFSQNFIVENLESVKTTSETDFKRFLMIDIQGFCDKEILHIFVKNFGACLQVEKSTYWFSILSINSINYNYEKTRFYKFYMYFLHWNTMCLNWANSSVDQTAVPFDQFREKNLEKPRIGQTSWCINEHESECDMLISCNIDGEIDQLTAQVIPVSVPTYYKWEGVEDMVKALSDSSKTACQHLTRML